MCLICLKSLKIKGTFCLVTLMKQYGVEMLHNRDYDKQHKIKCVSLKIKDLRICIYMSAQLTVNVYESAMYTSSYRLGWIG